MKGLLSIWLLWLCLPAAAQNLTGYWYGSANAKTANSANNYLMELILLPERSGVKGVLNYYFKNTYRSVQVEGNYNATSRQLTLKDVPVTYYGSISNFEVDCMMDMTATLRVAQAGSTLSGLFRAGADYKYSCPDVQFTLSLDSEVSQKDSVARAIREFRETYQVWAPTESDTLVAVTVEPRKVVNYPIQREFTERKNEVANEIEVSSDELKVDIYDNGEVDGDIISVFFNGQLIVFNQRLTHRSIKINLRLDSLLEVNELSMFAENLGLIPPNTALMRIRDGNTLHELRLSSTLDKNATIRIRRKK